jgi:hypothetical protein
MGCGETMVRHRGSFQALLDPSWDSEADRSRVEAMFALMQGGRELEPFTLARHKAERCSPVLSETFTATFFDFGTPDPLP